MATLTDSSRTVRLAKRSGLVDEIPTRENRGEKTLPEFDEYFEALRRIEQRIAEAEGDPSLKRFWLGLKREYQVEFDLLAQEVHRS